MYSPFLARNSSGTVGTVAGGILGCIDAVTLSGDLVVSAGGSLTINIAPGECIVPGSLLYASAVSGYYLRNSSTLNVSLNTPNPSNPRIDLVCATVNDATYHGATNNGVIQAVPGVATSGATLSNLSGAASLPDASLLIGYVLVPAAADSIVSGDIGDHRSPLALGVGPVDTGWLTLPVQGDWTSYPGPPYFAGAYRLQGNIVRLRGSIGGGLSGTEPFLMPVGTRPGATIAFNPMVYDSDSGVSVPGGFISIASTGAGNAVYAAGTTSIFLDGISYSVD